jgi:xanthosine utilization system XapX-like protein
VATFIVGLVLAIIPGPPALALALLGGILAGATFTLVLLVLRSLLSHAVSMRAELEEVV